MADVAQIWQDALPDVKDSVTGAGVWAALNTSVPIAFEDGVLVLGIPHEQNELASHLRQPLTKRAIESQFSRKVNQSVSLEVIDGITQADWETEKMRDREKRKLQDQIAERTSRERKVRTNWQGVYDEVSNLYSSVENRTLPQSRASYFLRAVEIVSEALTETPTTDELSERSYARCIERIAQYTEIPSTLVALAVLEKTFKG